MKKILSSFIRKRNDKYYVYVEYIDEVGKKKQKSQGSYANKKDADKKLIEVKNSINLDSFIIPQNITFVERFKKYNLDRKNTLSENTFYSREVMLKKHIKPYWGDTKLCDITIGSYQNFINKIYSSDYSDSTKKAICKTANTVLKECYRCREIKTPITDFVKIPKFKKPEEVSVYSIEEIKLILKEAKNRNNPGLEIAINLFVFGGLRRGETLGLTWDCVDFDNNRIKIENNLQYIAGKGLVMTDTKTTSSNREISLPASVMDLMKKERIRQNKLKLKSMLHKKYDTVVIDRKGDCYTTTSFQGVYQTLIKKTGLEYKKIHALRHSNVSILIANGIDVKTISERLGHSSIDITLQTYTHAFKEKDRHVSNRLDELLGQ